jgi:hypothetical protein
MDSCWIVIYSNPSPIKAEMLRQVLEENCITAVVVNQHDSSFTTFGDAEVYVQEEFVEQAMKIAERFGN